MSNVNENGIPFLDLVTPHVELEQELTKVFHETLRTAGFIGGPMVENFEKEFAAFCHTERAVAVLRWWIAAVPLLAARVTGVAGLTGPAVGAAGLAAWADVVARAEARTAATVAVTAPVGFAWAVAAGLTACVSAADVAGPTMPSTVRPCFAWKLRIAAPV